MCPKVKSFAETINPTEPLFLALWNVNRRGFNSCTVDKRTSKRLVRCNVPDYEKKYTMRVQVSFFSKFFLSYFLWRYEIPRLFLPLRPKKAGRIEKSLVLQEVILLWHLAKWVSRAPPHHTLSAFLDLNSSCGEQRGCRQWEIWSNYYQFKIA